MADEMTGQVRRRLGGYGGQVRAVPKADVSRPYRKIVTGRLKTSQPGSNQNRPF